MESYKNSKQTKTLTASKKTTLAKYQRTFSADDVDYVEIKDLLFSKQPVPSKITYSSDSVFNFDSTHVLAHCVSADLKMSAGIAEKFVSLYGRSSISTRRTIVGSIVNQRTRPLPVICLVTKDYFYNKPRYADLCSSLCELRDYMLDFGYTKLAIPRIGCNLDKLDWSIVSRMIDIIFTGNFEIVVAENALKQFPEQPFKQAILAPPKPSATQIKVAKKDFWEKFSEKAKDKVALPFTSSCVGFVAHKHFCMKCHKFGKCAGLNCDFYVCPYCSSKHHDEFKQISYCIHLRAELKPLSINERQQKVVKLLQTSLDSNCSCVYNQIPAAYRSFYMAQVQYSRVPKKNRVAPIAIFTDIPSDDLLQQQSQTIKAATKRYERRVIIANSIDKRSWKPGFNTHVSEFCSPEPMNTNLIRKIQKYTLSDVPVQPKKQDKAQKVAANLLRQQKAKARAAYMRKKEHIERMYLDRLNKKYAGSLRECEFDDEEIHAKVERRKHLKSYLKIQREIKNALNVDLKLVKSEQQPSNVPLPNEYHLRENGDIYYLDEKITNVTDQNYSDILFNHLIKIRKHLLPQYQTGVTDAIKKFVLASLDDSLFKDPSFKILIGTQISAFLLGTVSGIVALIDAARNEASWPKIILHILNIISQLTNAAYTFYWVSRVRATGKVYKDPTMAEPVTKSLAASLIHYLALEGIVPEKRVEELMQAADIKDAIIAPDKDDIKHLEALKQMHKGLQYTEMAQFWTENKNFEKYLRPLALLDNIDFSEFVDSGLDGDITFNTFSDLASFLESEISDELTPRQKSIANLDNCIVTLHAIQALLPDIKTVPKFWDNPQLLYLLSNLDKQTHLLDPRGDFPTTQQNIIQAWVGFKTYVESDPVTKVWLKNRVPYNPSTMFAPFKFTVPVDQVGRFTNLFYQSGTWDLITRVVVTLCASGITLCELRNSKLTWSQSIIQSHKLSSVMRDVAKGATDLMEDFAYIVNGTVIGDKYGLRKMTMDYYERLLRYKEIDDGEYCQNPHMFIELKELLAEVAKCVQNSEKSTKDLSAGEQQLLIDLRALRTTCEAKLNLVKSKLNTLQTKPSTGYTVIYGAKGCGKTYFVSRYLCPQTLRALQKNEGVYSISFNSDGNSYWPVYAQQTIGKVDDFLKFGMHDPLIQYSQNFFGTDVMLLEGAFDKDQRNHAMRHVFMSSNYCTVPITKGNQYGYTPTSIGSVLSRGRWIQCFNRSQWANGVPTNAERDLIEHDENFEDLEFFEYAAPGVEDYYRHNHQEALKDTYPTLDRSQRYSCTVVDGVRSFTLISSGPEPEEVWYRQPYGACVFYVKKVTKEQIVQNAINSIARAEADYDRFLDTRCREILSGYTPDTVPPRAQLTYDCGIQCVGKARLDRMLETEFSHLYPAQQQSGPVNSTNHLIISVTGSSGTGKSYLVNELLAPGLHSSLKNLPVIQVATVEDVKHLNRPVIACIHDQVRKQQGDLYLDILAHLPSPSIVFITENMYLRKCELPGLCVNNRRTNYLEGNKYLVRPLMWFAFMFKLTTEVGLITERRNGIPEPLRNMHEGWARRVAMSERIIASDDYNHVMSSYWQCISKFFVLVIMMALLSFIVFQNFSGFIFVPFVIMCFAILLYSTSFLLPEVAELSYTNQDYFEHLEMIGYGRYQTADGKQWLDSQILPNLYEKYICIKQNLSTIRILPVSEPCASDEADVMIIAPTMKQLPSYINSPSEVFKTVTFGRPTGASYQIALSAKVSRASFSVCVGDFRLQENPDREEVIQMAKRTYSILASGGADLSVSVRCADFQVFAQRGVIKYWSQVEHQSSIWSHSLSEHRGVKGIRVHHHVNGEEKRVAFVSFDNLVQFYQGRPENVEEADIEMATYLWSQRLEIENLTPMTDRTALHKASLVTGEEVLDKFNESVQIYRNMLDSTTGIIITSILGIMGAASFSAILYAIMRPSKKSLETTTERSQELSKIKGFTFEILSNTIVHSVTAHISLIDPVNCAVTFNYNDSHLSHESVKTGFISELARKSTVSLQDLQKIKFDYTFNCPVSQTSSKYEEIHFAIIPVDFDYKSISVCGDDDILTAYSRSRAKDGNRSQYRMTVFWDSTSYNSNPTVRIEEWNNNRYSESFSVDTEKSGILRDIVLDWYLSNDHMQKLDERYEQEITQIYNSAERKTKDKNAKGKTRLARFIAAFQAGISTAITTKNGKITDIDFESVREPKYESVKTIPPINDYHQSEKQLLDRVDSNIVYLFNETLNFHQYGLGLGDRLILVNAHFVSDDAELDQEIKVHLDNPRVKGDTLILKSKIKAIDRTKDFAILEIPENQAFRFKKIWHLFIDSTETARVRTGLFVRPVSEGLRTVQADVAINQRERAVHIRTPDGDIDTLNLCWVEASFMDSGFSTLPGDCGCPYLVKVPGKYGDSGTWKIAGIHSVGTPGESRAMAPLITSQFIQETIDLISNASAPQFETLSKKDFKVIQYKKNGLQYATPDIKVAVQDSVLYETVREFNLNPFTPKYQYPLFKPNKFGISEVPSGADASLKLLACTKNFRPSHLSKPLHQRSILADECKKIGVPDLVAPTAMDAHAVENPENLILSKCGRQRSIPFTQIGYYNEQPKVSPFLKSVLKDAENELRPLYQAWYKSKNHRILTPEETINGLYYKSDHFYGGLEATDRDASLGWYASSQLGISKRKQILVEDDRDFGPATAGRILYKYADTPEAQILKDRADYKYTAACKGIWVIYLDKDSLKQETVKLANVKKGKTRVFCSVDNATNMMARRICGTMIAQVKRCHRSRHVSIGVDPAKEFNHLYNRLLNTSSISVAGDFRHFDKSMVTQVVAVALRLWLSVYEACIEDEDELDNIRKCLQVIYLDLIHGYNICEEYIYRRNGGMPSGHLLTANINSEVNFIYHVLVCKLSAIQWNLTHMDSPIDCSTHNILKHTDILCYGDDQKIAISGDYVHVWNFESFRKVFSDYLGLQYTNPDKSDATYLTQPMDKLGYLSREFTKAPTGVIFPQLKKESLSGMLYWTTSNSQEVLGNTLENLWQEIRLLPKEDYLQWRVYYHAAIARYEKIYPGRSLKRLPEYEVNVATTTKMILNKI